MTWLKAHCADEANWSALLAQVVADSRRLPCAGTAPPHVYVMPERRELYCDAVALATLNALIALEHLDEVASMPASGLIAIVPETPPVAAPLATSWRIERDDTTAWPLLPEFGAQPA